MKHHGGGLPAWVIAGFLLGAAAALVGGYWDDVWHTERGRDSFLIAPHIAIFGGVTFAGALLGFWLANVARKYGVRAVLNERALLLAFAALSVTLLSGPIDNAWHEAFGRDAVIWSPPHAMGILGLAAVAVAVLVELVNSPAAWARKIEPIAGGLVLAAFAFLVVEYETDVPQFAELWYLPVLTAVSALALSLVSLASGRRWAATEAAIAYTVFIVLIAAYLESLGFDTPQLPLIVFPAVVFDLISKRQGSPLVKAVAYTSAVYLVYVPVRNLLNDGVALSASDVAIGLPIAGVAAALILMATERPQALLHYTGLSRATIVIALLIAISAPFAGIAAAHDPGQGLAAGTIDLRVQITGRDVRVEARRRNARSLGEGELIARRAGKVIRAPLSAGNGSYAGRVHLSGDGRWFVYVRLPSGRQTVEAWLPASLGTGHKSLIKSRRFAYYVKARSATPLKSAAGGLIYAAMAGFLAMTVALVRASARQRS